MTDENNIPINKREMYTTISLPKGFLKGVKIFVAKSDKYRSIAEFTREAINEKLQREKGVYQDRPVVFTKEDARRLLPFLEQIANKEEDTTIHEVHESQS